MNATKKNLRDVSDCPKCGASCTPVAHIRLYKCHSWRTFGIHNERDEFTQSDTCRITELEAEFAHLEERLGEGDKGKCDKGKLGGD